MDQNTLRDTPSSGPVDIRPRLRAVLGVPIIGELAITGGVEVKTNAFNNILSPSAVYSPALVFGMQI